MNQLSRYSLPLMVLRHRTQYVAEIGGRDFYNDSKATNILAASSALNAFKQPIILLAGGLDRGNGFEELIPSLNGVKAMILFGQTAKKLRKQAGQQEYKTSIMSIMWRKLFQRRIQASEAGDVILLSPACASWDQYRTFEVRGDIFINAVHKLKESE